MNTLEKDFLTLIKNCLYGKKENIESNLNELEHLALTHICVPIVYRGALNAGISIGDEWKKYVMASSFRNQKNLQVQSAILQKLKDADIPCAVIKGSTVSVNYPEPMIRTLGDIDILVNVSDYEKAIELLCGNEYEDESSENHQFHYKYTTQDVAVEIHKSVTEYSNNEYGEKVKSFMNNALDDIKIKQIDEFSFPSLVDKYQAATLLLHTQRHFYENRLPIRMLCDWAMFVESVPKEDWDNIVYPFISAMELNSLCDGLCAVCAEYLGTDCIEKVKGNVDEETKCVMIEEFLNCGVIKDEDTWSKSVASDYSQKRKIAKGKVIPFFMLLNDIARHEFKLSQKSLMFLPFCWTIIGFRYIFRRISGKRGRVSFKAFNETAERKELLIEKLNLKD
jgi:hypothetical protein